MNGAPLSWNVRSCCRTLALPLLALALVAPALAFACQCGRKPPAAEALQKADVVFVGTVVSNRVGKEERRQGTKTVKVLSHMVVTLRVSAAWKGGPGEEIVLRTTIAGCEASFTRGVEYLVYAVRLSPARNGLVWEATSECDGTTAVENAREDLAALGKPLSARPGP